MTVLVTGGAGYIGSHTVLGLLESGYDVVCADNFSNSKPGVIDRIRRISGKDFRFYNADVRDGSRLDDIFNENEIGCVIHFAGLKAIGESVSVPLLYYGNNVGSTLALCGCMQKHGVGMFIFSSTATVYSGENLMPLTESSATGNCINPYSWSKFMCEQILRDAANTNPDMAVCLLRYFNPIGAHISGKIGEDPKGIPNNLLPFIAKVAAGKLERLNVFGNDYDTPDGTCIRDYIHVTDLAQGHIAAIQYLEKNKGTHVFNLGTGRGTSVLEFIDAFENSTGVKIPKEITGRRPGDLPVTYACTRKAENELGFCAKKTVRDGCADTWRWQRDNPDGIKQ